MSARSAQTRARPRSWSWHARQAPRPSRGSGSSSPGPATVPIGSAPASSSCVPTAQADALRAPYLPGRARRCGGARQRPPRQFRPGGRVRVSSATWPKCSSSIVCSGSTSCSRSRAISAQVANREMTRTRPRSEKISWMLQSAGITWPRIWALQLAPLWNQSGQPFSRQIE